MGQKNKISEGYIYFLTLTVVDWVGVFTRPIYRHIVVDALKHCQKTKGLEIYAWVLMSNHLHLLASANEGKVLSDILRDFKKFTSKKVVETIFSEPESRRKWMINQFEFAGRYDPKITNYTFWQSGNEAKEVHTNDFLFQKLNYIHENPVRVEIVAEPEHYLYSSASNYTHGKGLLDVIVL